MFMVLRQTFSKSSGEISVTLSSKQIYFSIIQKASKTFNVQSLQSFQIEFQKQRKNFEKVKTMDSTPKCYQGKNFSISGHRIDFWSARKLCFQLEGSH